MPDDLWYADGLRFACTGCGRCCTGASGHVWVRRDEIERLAARTGLSLDGFGSRFLRRVGSRYALVNGPDGNCVFLAGRSCSVYDERPSQCRSYPWWPVNLASQDAWQVAAESCEGICASAPVVAADVIEEQRKVAENAGLAAYRDGNQAVDSPGRPTHVAKS